MDENMLWDIRHFVYRHFAETTHPPRTDEVAAQFALTHEQAGSAYEELHRRHALFLKPETHDILMANPFSGIETPFKVHIKDKTFFANCAWDSLGIPAALQADAEVEAACAQSGEPVSLTVSGGQILSSDALVHFLIPFRNWYDNLSFT